MSQPDAKETVPNAARNAALAEPGALHGNPMTVRIIAENAAFIFTTFTDLNNLKKTMKTSKIMIYAFAIAMLAFGCENSNKEDKNDDGTSASASSSKTSSTSSSSSSNNKNTSTTKKTWICSKCGKKATQDEKPGYLALSYCWSATSPGGTKYFDHQWESYISK